jgi:hypothetical protein
LFGVVPAQIFPSTAVWPPSITVRRQRQGFAKRGKIFSPPWTGAAINAFVWFPKQLPKNRKFGILLRRGKRSDAPISQAVAPVAVWPPATISRRIKLYRGQTRGKRWEAVSGAYMAVQQVSQRRIKPVLARRARIQPIIALQQGVITRIRKQPVRLGKQARGRILRFRVFQSVPLAFPIRNISRRTRYQFQKRGKRWEPANLTIPFYIPRKIVKGLILSASYPKAILETVVEEGVLNTAKQVISKITRVGDEDGKLLSANEDDEGKLRKVD